MTKFEIAKMAYEDLKNAIEQINNKHNVTCAIPSIMVVDGELFYYYQFEEIEVDRKWSETLCKFIDGQINIADHFPIDK
jgi:hypothetical protein